LLAPFVIAIAYEKLMQDQESDWDFAQDCLATHAPPGALNLVTGVGGIAAMLWLYGVAWHRPLADTVASVGTSIVKALPSMQSMIPPGLTDGSVITGVVGGIRRPDQASAVRPDALLSAPLDADVATLFAERRARVSALKAEGPRMLRSGDFRRAAELCGAWANLELANADAWRCVGEAQQGLGNHQEALNAFRKAKQADPNDRSLDAAIDRAQKGIVGDFRNRYRK
jgi:hypothetical protein